jgi:Fic family protein
VDLQRFRESPLGSLVPFSGTDALGVPFSHAAFSADPLNEVPSLLGATWTQVGAARAALGRLHQGSRFVGNTALLRQPTLRREAQSTSALEGTFAPLEEVLAADVIDQSDRSGALNEVLNFVSAAEMGFGWVTQGRPVSVSLLCSLHKILVQGTPADNAEAGRVRQIQVAIGSRGGRVEDARFVPMRPGPALAAAVSDTIGWLARTAGDKNVDPVVAAAMVHYQFETLHPFNDGNGRVGRLLIVLQLLQAGVLPDSLLSVSPWFETRRDEYQDSLAEVSATGNWDQWIEFFARGLESAALDTARRIETVLDIRDDFHSRLAASNIRGIARDIADYVVSNPYVTLPQLAAKFTKPYQSIKDAAGRLIELGILEDVPGSSQRILRAPHVIAAYRQ